MKITHRASVTLAVSASLIVAPIVLPDVLPVVVSAQMPISKLVIESALASGRINPTTINTVLNGKGAPTKQLGNKGDFYIDITTFTIYGPKANNSWPVGISLRTSANSLIAATNKNSTSANISTSPKNGPSPTVIVQKGASGLQGAQGPQGPQGIAGPQGEKGDKGEPGAPGPAGKDGEPGAPGGPGPAGPSGSSGPTGATGATGPAGPIGLTGPTGLTGLTGAQGSQGIQGIQGPQGIQGVAGPSAVTTGLITFAAPIATPGGTATSAAFGNLHAGKKYLIHFSIRGISTKNSTMRIGANINYQSGISKVLDDYQISNGDSYRGGVLSLENNVSGFSVISNDVASTATGISIAITTYLASNDDALTLTGSYTCQEVGAVS